MHDAGVAANLKDLHTLQLRERGAKVACNKSCTFGKRSELTICQMQDTLPPCAEHNEEFVIEPCESANIYLIG